MELVNVEAKPPVTIRMSFDEAVRLRDVIFGDVDWDETSDPAVVSHLWELLETATNKE